VRVALMIEGQEGVSWDDWLGLARACEEHGVPALFRSDHYLAIGSDGGSLDAWSTVNALAAVTSTLRLGTLVSPATFRHPSVLAKSAVTADHVSGGRVEIGMGAGWFEDEHRAYGFEFHDRSTRLELFAEQLEIVHRLLTEERTSFSGRHYRLEDCPALPKPVQRPRPPLLVGGSAGRGTLDPAVRFADEYNTIFASVEELRERRRKLTEACERAGRDPGTMRFSMMTGFLVGADRAEARERMRRVLARSGRDEDPEEALQARANHWVVGSVEQAAEKLRALEEAGLDGVMLQHQDHTDLEAVELIGRKLVPALASPGV
jgi:F420-dependent oxidoreductase-like protein